MSTNANSTTTVNIVTTSVTIPVVAGRTYNFNFSVQAGKGYTSEGICGTVNSSVTFDVIAGAVTTNLAQAHTQTGTGVLVSSP